MPAMPPRAVLSEHLEAQLRGRRLLAGVFLTFRFDPGFFERDILPVFFNIPLSHAPAIKLVQLEDVLRLVPGGVAVYYDANGIEPSAGGARLDIQRIPICHRTGIFHPKNVFALVEEIDADDDGHRAQALLVSTLSANLTQKGWWENVEVCHTEEIQEGDATRLRDDLRGFLEALESRAGAKAAGGHGALRAIRSFVVRQTDQRSQRTSGGHLHTHFFDGKGEVRDFIKRAAGQSLTGMNLEVISPYFDDKASALPLHDLLEQFEPRETRVFLPRNEAGDALCSEDVFNGVRQLEDVLWARLPGDLVKSGKGETARARDVHAKVYRFFQPSPRREVLFVGSVNLTSAAHRAGGNLETGFLVELDPAQKPDWWLSPDGSRPGCYRPQPEDEGTATSGGTRLAIRFSWDSGRAEAFWDSSTASPALAVHWEGTSLFNLRVLPSRDWVALDSHAAEELHRVLHSTSILTVIGENDDPGYLLVQEQGMHARPSVLLDLSPAEILRYWSLLSPAQRAEFVNAHASALVGSDEGAALLAQFASIQSNDSFFDKFAGIFLAFGCVERSVREALPAHPHQADHLLFGKKYDSLSSLLTKVVADAEAGKGELTEHYVTALCAQQLVDVLEREQPQFFAERRQDTRSVRAEIARACAMRDRLIAADPLGMPDFLRWFDRWFLERANVLDEKPA